MLKGAFSVCLSTPKSVVLLNPHSHFQVVRARLIEYPFGELYMSYHHMVTKTFVDVLIRVQ